MRRILIALFVFQAACSDEEPGRPYGDPSRVGDSASGGDAVTGDPLPGDPLMGDPLMGDPLAGDPLTGDPLAGDPLMGDPLAGDPLMGDPLAGDPLTGDPLMGDPLAGDPLTGDPLVGDPPAGDPLMGDPTPGDGLPAIADIIITEFRVLTAGEIEMVELYNRGSEDVDIGPWTLNGTEIDHPHNIGAAVIVAAGAYSLGLNAPDIMPMMVPWAYGPANLSDTGDTLVLADEYGRIVDTVDFTNLHTEADTMVSADAFPAVVNVSTQLDVDAFTGDNDDGDLWCVTFGVRDTGGSANHSCRQIVINEVLYDWAHPTLGSNDNRRAFVELAGPGGASLARLRLSGIAGAGSVGQDQTPVYNFGDERFPLDGILVIADGDADDGETFVPNADIVRGQADPQNGPDAVKLRDRDTDEVIDLVGYGLTLPDPVLYETAPHPYIASGEGTAIAIARDALSTDTDNNSADFHFDPTATPGLPNDEVVPTILDWQPDNCVVDFYSLPVEMTTLDITTFHSYEGDMTNREITGQFAGVDGSNCGIIDALDDGRGAATITCRPQESSVAIRGDIVLTNPPALGGTAMVTDAWTYTGVNNETDTAAEADWCTIESPATIDAGPGDLVDVYGKLYEAGVTEAAGESSSVIAEFGYGPSGHDPTTTGTWSWMPAGWNAQTDNDDQYVTQLQVPDDLSTGTHHFYYAYRFSFDDGITYTYCDVDGAGSNATMEFDYTDTGFLTVIVP